MSSRLLPHKMRGNFKVYCEKKTESKHCLLFLLQLQFLPVRCDCTDARVTSLGLPERTRQTHGTALSRSALLRKSWHKITNLYKFSMTTRKFLMAKNTSIWWKTSK